MSTNPLLNKIRLPGRMFQLPSKGVFYKEDVLSEAAKRTGDIQVTPMSAMSELVLKNADLLYTGRAFSELCRECIPDILKPEELCGKDVDAIFVFLKIATYGAEMTINYQHNCKDSHNHSYTFNLEEIASALNNSIINENIDLLYTCQLDENTNVKLKPVKFVDIIDFFQLSQEYTTWIDKNKTLFNPEYIKKINTKEISQIIDNVNGITDQGNINEWISTLTSSEIKKLKDQFQIANNWGISLMQKLQCKDCKEIVEYDMELNAVSFFSE